MQQEGSTAQLKPETIRDKGAEAMIANVDSGAGMVRRIDDIRVSESERRIAKEHLHQAEFIADLICRACKSLCAAAKLASRSLFRRASERRASSE